MSAPKHLYSEIPPTKIRNREEKFRETSTIYEQIRDRFGTNEPEKIKAFFDERRKTTETLEKQIQHLKIASEELEKNSSHLKSALEEAEYASAKGVGGNRLLTEGKKILNKKKEQLNENKRKKSATLYVS